MWEETSRIMLLFIVCMILGQSFSLPTTTTTPPSSSEETDGEVSRKILGSSVVTSVSVIMDHGNGSQTYYSDAVGKPLPKPFAGSQLASPINLLNPDRYEFYTFDDNDDLVKRLMTLAEIQSIIANGNGDNSYNSQFWAPGEPEKRVEDVVNNVQNVLKEEMEAHKASDKKPIFINPQITSNWNMILPPIFSNLAETSIVNNSTTNEPRTTEKITTTSDLFASKTDTPDVPVITVDINSEQEKNVTKETPIVATTNPAEKTTEPEKLETVQITVNTPTWSPFTNKFSSPYGPTIFVPSSPSPFSLVPEITTGTALNRFPSTALPSTLEDLQPLSTTYLSKRTTQEPSTTQFGDLSTYFYVETDKQETKQESTTKTGFSEAPYTYLDLTTGTYKTTNDFLSAKTESSTRNFETTLDSKTESSGIREEMSEEKQALSTLQEAQTTNREEVASETVTTGFTTSEALTNKPTTILVTEKVITTEFPSTTENYQTDRVTITEKLIDPTTTERTTETQDMAVTQLLNQLLHSTNALEINSQLLGDMDAKTDRYELFSTTENQKESAGFTTSQQTTQTADDNYKLIATSNTEKLTKTPTTESKISETTNVDYTTSTIPSTLGEEQVNLAVDSLLSQIISQHPTTIEDIETTPRMTTETKYELLSRNKPETTAKPTTIKDFITTNDYKTRYDEIDLEQPLSTINLESKTESASIDDYSTTPVKSTSVFEETQTPTILQTNPTLTIDSSSQTNSDFPSKQPTSLPTTIGDTTKNPTVSAFQSTQPSTVLISTQTTTDFASTQLPGGLQNDAPLTSQVEAITQTTSGIEESTVLLRETTSLNNADNYKKITQEVTEPILVPSTTALDDFSDFTSTENVETYTTNLKTGSEAATTKLDGSNNVQQQTTESISLSEDTTVLDVQTTQKAPHEELSKTTTASLVESKQTTAKVSFTETSTITSADVTTEAPTTETNDLFVTVPIFTTSPKINKQPEFKVILNTTSTSTQPPETTWTLVSTVLPHKTAVEQLKIQAQNQSIPTSVDLVPRPLQGYGLEDSTSGLDTDVFQFTELCNELAFSFWNSVTTGISFARSVVISPFAMTSMLAMVFLGARGSTSGEMNDILKLDEMVTFNPHAIFRSVVESIEVSKKSGVAVSVFARELYSDKNKGKLLGFYKERVKQFYDGHVEEVNFKEINDVLRRRTNLLVKRYTWGKISEYLKDNNLFVRPPLAAVSANIFQTDCSQASVEGRDGELHFVVLPSIRQRKLIPIPAAVWRSGFLAGYDPGLDATAVAIGTKDYTISTIFVIPGQQGISAPGDGLMRLENRLVENAYRQNAWNRLLRSLIPRPGLEVQIPRFSHKSVINATMALQRMGLKDLFNSREADLKGLNGAAHEFYLSDIVQVNTFATCGEGKIGETHHSEIYPATTNRSFRRIRKIQHSKPAVENTDNSEEPRDYQRAFHDPLFDPSHLALPLQLRPRQARIPEAPRLRFDRPFLYFVRHNPTGLILHMGRFNPRLLP